MLKGRYHFLRLTGPALEKSLNCFTAALAVEPTYAQAHAGVAMVQALRSFLSVATPSSIMPEARQAAQRALTVDQTVADAHAALGTVLHLYQWDWEGAVQEYRRALDLNPGDTFTRGMCAVLLALLGRPNESVAEARGSVERDPLAVFNRHVLALVLYLDRRYEAAIAEARAGFELDQSSHFLYWDLGYSSTFLGRHDEAGAFPISRSRAHTHWRHGHPLQTVPSAGLIERP